MHDDDQRCRLLPPAVGLLAAVLFLLAANAAPAWAAPTRSTTGPAEVHSAPSFNATVTSTVPAGTPIVVTCQSYGTKTGGSFIWDRVGDGFVSDALVRGATTAFDPAVPRCGGNHLPVDCAKVLFLGARGSGEPFGPQNMGDRFSPVEQTFRDLAGLGGDLDAAGVIYPAQDVSILVQGDPVDYFGGVKQGTAVLLADLRARTSGDVCGWEHTRAVLVGYSQGAMVVGNAIEQMTRQERSTVQGVVTYGNPRYTPFLNGDVDHLPATGIAGSRLPYPDGVGARARDYCNADIVCAKTIDKDAHLLYVERGRVDAGAAFLRSRL